MYDPHTGQPVSTTATEIQPETAEVQPATVTPVEQEPADPGEQEPSRADEPGTLAPVPPDVPENGDAPPSETGVITAAGTHPSVLVRLSDVLAHLENWLARNPSLRAPHEADLKSGLAAIEQHRQ